MIDNSMCKDCKFVCLMYCFFFLRMNMCKKKSCFKGLIICVTDIFEIHKLGKVTQCVKAIYSGIMVARLSLIHVWLGFVIQLS